MHGLAWVPNKVLSVQKIKDPISSDTWRQTVLVGRSYVEMSVLLEVLKKNTKGYPLFDHFGLKIELPK